MEGWKARPRDASINCGKLKHAWHAFVVKVEPKDKTERHVIREIWYEAKVDGTVGGSYKFD